MARGAAETLLWGIHPVREALRAGRRPLHRLSVRAGRSGPEVEALRAAAERAGVAVEEVDAARLESLAAGASTQGVLLQVGPLPEVPLEELAAAPGPGGGSRTLVALDGVEDPQNVGAIARAAEASGATGLVLTRRRAPPLGGAVSRASSGAIEWLPVARVPNLVRALGWLQQRGFWSFGCDSEAGDDLFTLPGRVVAGDRVVVLGAEASGLRQGVWKAIDHRVRIPMAGHLDSLNVGSAAAVVLFELRRRESLAGT